MAIFHHTAFNDVTTMDIRGNGSNFARRTIGACNSQVIECQLGDFDRSVGISIEQSFAFYTKITDRLFVSVECSFEISIRSRSWNTKTNRFKICQTGTIDIIIKLNIFGGDKTFTYIGCKFFQIIRRLHKIWIC